MEADGVNKIYSLPFIYFFSHTHKKTIVKSETLNFVMGGVRTHNLLIFGQTPKPLFILMTLGFSKDIQCHARPYFTELAGNNIRSHIKWVVSLVIAYGCFNLPRGVCVGMYGLILHHPPRVMYSVNEIPCQTQISRFKIAHFHGLNKIP